MKVIKHGDTCQDFSVPVTITCTECNCTFEYEEADVTPTISQDNGARFFGIVYCPECRSTQIVRCNKEYWEGYFVQLYNEIADKTKKLLEANDDLS